MERNAMPRLIRIESADGEDLRGEVLEGDSRNADLYQQEGFHHLPEAGADAVLAFIGDGESHPVAIAPRRAGASSEGAGVTVVYSTSGGSPVAKITLDTTGDVTIDAPGAATIKLGASAAEAVIKGNTYTTAETTFLTGLNTLLAALKVYIQAIQPIADPPNSATPVLAAAIDACVAIITTFSGSLPGALSIKSLTE